MNCNVASNCPSRIIRWITISALNTTVHVDSRSRICRVRKISATPASPVWVATRIFSIYFDLGAASCPRTRSHRSVFRGGIDRGTIVTERNATHPVLTLIFVAPFTDFSKLWDIVAGLLFFSFLVVWLRSWAVIGIRRMPRFQIETREGGEKSICATGNDDNGFITVSKSDLPIVLPGAAFGVVH